MSLNQTALVAGIPDYSASLSDYFTLLKPRVMSLSVLTALAGLLIAPAHVNPVVGFAAILAIAIGAGAAGALNMWWDADIDVLMARTRLRPIPAGRIAPNEALFFGLTLALIAVLMLAVVANLLAAALLAFTILFYVVIYTMWLKRRTHENIVIGGAAGALPPMVGYAAATGSVSLDSFTLFAIIFLWTPPHFWALALVKSADYGRAGIPMMPNVKGEKRTKAEILAYPLLLAPVALLPRFMGFAGGIYAAAALIAGAAMIVLAVRVNRTRDEAQGKKASMQLFGCSILYLFALFVTLVVEHSFGLIDRFGL